MQRKLLSFVIIILAIAIIFVGTAVYPSTGELLENSTTDAFNFNKDYPLVGKDNVFVYAEAEDVIDILDSGSGIIYFGFPQCKWCQIYVPMLNNAAIACGIDKIYYCNIRNERENETYEYKTLVSLIRKFLELDSKGEPRIFVPEVIVVKDGTIIGNDHETSKDTNNINSPELYWNHERVNVLNEKFEILFDRYLK